MLHENYMYLQNLHNRSWVKGSIIMKYYTEFYFN